MPLQSVDANKTLLVYVVGLHAVQFGKKLGEKNSDSGQNWLSEEFLTAKKKPFFS